MVNQAEIIKPSWSQKFLWHIAGSDINVLRSCNAAGNIYNKHAGIGFTILVTTLVAVTVSSIAGYTFSQSMIGAICVGLVWGIVIFSVDRNMVMFLKKDVQNSNKGMLLAFLIRALLAVLISFFISIPLELLIFKQEIAIQMVIDRDNEFLDNQNVQESKFQIEKKKVENDSIFRKKQELEKSINDSPPGPVYQQLVDQLNNQENLLNNLRKTHRNKIAERRQYYDQSLTLVDSVGKRIPDRYSTAYKQFILLYNETVEPNGTLSKQISALDREIQEIKARKNEIEDAYKKRIEENIQLVGEDLAEARKELAQDTLKRNQELGSYETLLKGSTGFTRQWKALNNINNSATNILIWLLRAVLFLIEIAPTALKIIGKPDIYDYTLQYGEQNAIKNNKKIFKEFSKHNRKNLHTNLDSISTAQNELSQDLIDKWKEKMKEKIDNEIETYIS